MTQQRLIPRQLSGSDPGAARARGVAADVEDPLWFLSRQWQLGELEAGDGGSLVACSFETRDLALDRIRWKDQGEFEPFEARELPLEAVVENGPGPEGVTAPSIEERLSSPTPAWDAPSLTHRFALSAAAEPATRLVASDFDGGRLDWYHFTCGAISPGTPFQSRPEGMPSPVRLSGGPRPRWWEIEDDRVDMGALTRPEIDLVTMLLMEYVLTSSTDWYLVPLLQRAGSVRSIRSATAIDSFGAKITLAPHEPGPEGPGAFAMFSLGRLSSAHHFLPRTKEGALFGEPLEQVVWKRDEDANLVWAVEQVRFDAATGRPRVIEDEAPSEPALGAAEPAIPRYRLMTHPPSAFFPFAPTGASGGRLDPIPPAGRAPQTALVRTTPHLRDEALPASPLCVEQRLEAVRRAPAAHGPGPYFFWLGRGRAPGVLRQRFTWKTDFLEGP